MRMGLRAANQHFSEAIKAVRSGQQVVLTDRGKPIAVIQPLPEEDKETGVIKRLIAEGLLVSGARFGLMPPHRVKPIRIKGVPLSKSLRQDRDAR